MNKSRWVVGMLICLVAVGVQGNEVSQEGVALGWVEAHNSGSVETMADFRAQHFNRSDAADWRTNFGQMVAVLGVLEIEGVTVEKADELRLHCRSERRGEMVLVFAFYPDAPDQIKKISLDSMGRASSGLPPLELQSDDWSGRQEEIDRYLEGLAARDRFSGTVMVIERGTVQFEGAYGLASREFNAPNTLDTRFDVGSFNKDYTRAAILQLLEAEKLALSDTVGQHLPDYPNKNVKKKVTIEQLLEHRSGLGDYFTDEYFETPMGNLREIDDYIPIWGPLPLEYEPGEKEQYSNYGYTVLGAIIEKVSGMSYPDYVVEKIFEPAGMTRSGFFETDRPEPDVAVGYTRMRRGGQRSDRLLKNIYLEPAKGGPWGKSYSTVRDLYRFFEAMFDGRLVSEENNWLAARWDLGIALAGGGPGLNASLLLTDGTMILVMANMDPPIADDVARTLRDALP
jgi:CubicO group peptidase (beta-lactamase class C family)